MGNHARCLTADLCSIATPDPPERGAEAAAFHGPFPALASATRLRSAVAGPNYLIMIYTVSRLALWGSILIVGFPANRSVLQNCARSTQVT